MLVSVPLASTSLSPHQPLVGSNQTSVLAVAPFSVAAVASAAAEKSGSVNANGLEKAISNTSIGNGKRILIFYYFTPYFDTINEYI